MKRIYLDHAATTPIDARARKAMEPFLRKKFGNPSALYAEGVEAKDALTDARTLIAKAIGAHADEIVFTGSGTESDNLAIIGLVKQWYEHVPEKIPHIITTNIEHPAVREPLRELECNGMAAVTHVPVNEDGIATPKDVKEALQEETALVTIMHANNEIGTIQPVKEIAKVVRDYKKQNNRMYPYVHTDACQSFGYLDVFVERLGIDLMTFNGSKIYGPKGAGALYVKRGITLKPLIYGGGQESGLRSGTENIAGAIGLAEAVRITETIKEKEARRVGALRDYFIDELMRQIPSTRVNGSRSERLPNNVNVSISDTDNLELIMRLDAKGVACSAKSACKSSDEELSHVIAALGRGTEHETSSVRFSLGRSTTRKDIDTALGILSRAIAMMRRERQ